MNKSLAYINIAFSVYFNFVSQETQAIYWAVIAIFWLIFDIADKKVISNETSLACKKRIS